MQITINAVTELDKVAEQILTFFSHEKVFLFFGEMGAGKTTFIKTICKQLGVADTVSSPTYTIVNEYATIDFYPIYHFDFYRLKNETEVLDLGFEEYLHSDSYCFIEWPEKISSYWPKHYVKVTFTALNETERTISAEIIDE